MVEGLAHWCGPSGQTSSSGKLGERGFGSDKLLPARHETDRVGEGEVTFEELLLNRVVRQIGEELLLT